MLKFASTLFYIVFVSILVGVAGLLIGTMLPIPGNIEMKIVKSGSMEPAIPTGSIVVVKPSTSYVVGDVITFGEDTQTAIPTTHRITAIQGEGSAMTFTTKGDANEEADQNPVARGEVIGKVVFHLPHAGFVLDFARQPLGFVLLIAVPAALVILEEILTIFREATKGRRRRNDDDRGTSGGGSEPVSNNTLDLRGAPRIVYSQLRLMDEILVPTLEEVNESFKRRMTARNLPMARENALTSWLGGDAYGTSTALTICLVFASALFAGANGGTIAYFNDIERSLGNAFGAGLRWEEEALAAMAAMQMEESQLFEATALMEGDVLGEAAELTKPVEEPEPEPEEVMPEEPAAATEEIPTEMSVIPTEPEPVPVDDAIAPTTD